MKTFTIPILFTSILLLSACGNATPTEVNTTVPTSKVTTESSGATSDTNAPAPISQDVQAIIQLQLKTPDAVLKLDCESYDAEGKKYCTDEKAKLEALANEVTWEKVLKNDSEYISKFDCSTIVSPYGQKYCIEYQQNLIKAVEQIKKNGTGAQILAGSGTQIPN